MNSYAHYICTGGEDNCARGCEGHAFSQSVVVVMLVWKKWGWMLTTTKLLYIHSICRDIFMCLLHKWVGSWYITTLLTLWLQMGKRRCPWSCYHTCSCRHRKGE